MDASRGVPRRRGRRARLDHGPVGVRQVDAHAHHGRAGQAHELAQVEIAGTAISKLDDTDLTKLRRRNVGFVFQFFNLLPMLTAEENVTLPLQLAGGKLDKKWVADVIDRVGLTDSKTHRPAELSGGQQQRVAIARALVYRARPSSSRTSRPATSTPSRAARSSPCCARP